MLSANRVYYIIIGVIAGYFCRYAYLASMLDGDMNTDENCSVFPVTLVDAILN